MNQNKVIMDILYHELIDKIYSYLTLPKDAYRFSITCAYVYYCLPVRVSNLITYMQRQYHINKEINTIDYFIRPVIVSFDCIDYISIRIHTNITIYWFKYVFLYCKPVTRLHCVSTTNTIFISDPHTGTAKEISLAPSNRYLLTLMLNLNDAPFTPRQRDKLLVSIQKHHIDVRLAELFQAPIEIH